MRVLFRNEQDGRQYFIDGHASSTLKGMIYYQSDDLANLVSFNDPEDEYPNIKKEWWPAIRKGEVVRGMNENACLLSLGAPNQREGYNKGKGRMTVLYYHAAYDREYYLTVVLREDKVVEIRKSE